MQKITITEKLIRNENEAIEAIKANMPTSGYQMLRESLDMAIKALEEIQQYREIGTVEECREAVEKQKPKKARFYSWSLYCPDCGQLVGNRIFKWENNFCRNCGRAIDWSEEE